MSEKTLPEQARSFAKFIEKNNYIEWPDDWEIVQLLEDLAAEIERLQSELGIANKDYAGMSRTYVETRNERDRYKAERDKLAEFGEYLAKAAEWFIDSVNRHALVCDEINCDLDEATDAEIGMANLSSGLKFAIYEFRKRAKMESQ